MEEVRRKIRIDPDCHEPYTSLIVVENTHNMCGGKVSMHDKMRTSRAIILNSNVEKCRSYSVIFLYEVLIQHLIT